MSPLTLRLKEHRKAKGLTQAQLAKRVGVRQATISELERRASFRRLDVRLLDRIARTLAVRTIDLIAAK